MTDEEKAHKYAIGRTYPKFETNYIANFVLREVEGAFLAGLKAGRPQWHDLEKDPNDLPPKMASNHNFSIEVLSDKGELVCYNFHYCEWFYWRSGEPIAWCELPTFDKE